MKSSQGKFTSKDRRARRAGFSGQWRFSTTKLRFFVWNLWVSRTELACRLVDTFLFSARLNIKLVLSVLNLSSRLDILRIDNLWILPNLRILSLAFNKIDKIENLNALTELRELNMTFNAIEKLENLEALKKLEVLNVFGNKIRKIENLDELESLIIFSAGNNVIDTKDGVSLRWCSSTFTIFFILSHKHNAILQLERLRFLKRLRSLNLKGNPVERDDKFFRIYIGGLLPDLTYYEYRHIGKVEREEGKDRFRFKLREIMDNERVEVQEREKRTKDNLDFIHYSECFVEHLDKSQLFESLFDFSSEDEGKSLLMLNGEEQVLIAEWVDFFPRRLSPISFSLHILSLIPVFELERLYQISWSKCRRDTQDSHHRSRAVREAETRGADLLWVCTRGKKGDSAARTGVRRDNDSMEIQFAVLHFFSLSFPLLQNN